MPLARIITDVADDSLELTMQLRARGFQVETVAPGAIPATPADLEVRLQECAPEDMLTQAAQTSDADDLWVFVAPGALDESVRPIRTIPLFQRPLISSHAAPVSIRPEGEVVETKTETPQVVGSLAIDAQEEDLILAELREFPPVAPVVASASPAAARVESLPPLIEWPTLPDAVSQQARVSADAAPASLHGVIQEAGQDRVSNPPPVEVAFREKAETSAIPIAPEQVRRFVATPVLTVARAPKPARRWNLRFLKVACGTAVLVISAGLMVRTVRPDPVAVSTPPTTPLPLTPSPGISHSAAAGPTQPAKAVAPSPRSTTRALAIAPTRPSVPPVPKAAHHARKAQRTVAHSKDDGLIAQDTVVFYDRKPNSANAKARTEPGVKRYTDRN